MGSSSATATEAAPAVAWGAYPAPPAIVAVTLPFGSSASSRAVATSVDVTPVPTRTWRVPVWPPAAKPPLSLTATCTVMGSDGNGFAVSVKLAVPPSVTAGPAQMDTMGTAGSLSRMVSVWDVVPFAV